MVVIIAEQMERLESVSAWVSDSGVHAPVVSGSNASWMCLRPQVTVDAARSQGSLGRSDHEQTAVFFSIVRSLPVCKRIRIMILWHARRHCVGDFEHGGSQHEEW